MAVQLVERLQEVVEIPDHRIGLARAALVLSQFEYPNLNIESYLERLKSFSAECEARLRGRYDPLRVIEQLNGYLFSELGFAGNRADYYDPRNSFLNEVIDRRAGIPITLSVVYLEITRRLGLPFYGVGLPGHFLVKYDDGRQTIFVDPFHQGEILDERGCRELVYSVRGEDVLLTARDFAAVENRYILVRMLNNLRGIYLQRRQLRKALVVLEMFLTLHPGSADGIKQRGWLHYELRNWTSAREDFETYLALCPDSPDRDEINKWLEAMSRRSAIMN